MVVRGFPKISDTLYGSPDMVADRTAADANGVGNVCVLHAMDTVQQEALALPRRQRIDDADQRIQLLLEEQAGRAVFVVAAFRRMRVERQLMGLARAMRPAPVQGTVQGHAPQIGQRSAYGFLWGIGQQLQAYLVNHILRKVVPGKAVLNVGDQFVVMLHQYGGKRVCRHF